MTDLRVEYLDSSKGFKLVFDFDQGAQEFFSNKSLEKTYYYQEEVGVRTKTLLLILWSLLLWLLAQYEGDLIYDHAEGT